MSFSASDLANFLKARWPNLIMKVYGDVDLKLFLPGGAGLAWFYRKELYRRKGATWLVSFAGDDPNATEFHDLLEAAKLLEKHIETIRDCLRDLVDLSRDKRAYVAGWMEREHCVSLAPMTRSDAERAWDTSVMKSILEKA